MQIVEAMNALRQRRMSTGRKGCLSRIGEISTTCSTSRSVIRNALKMLLYLTQVREEILEGVGNGGYDRLYPEILEEHESLWTVRNKRSGLEDGIRMFERLR